MKKRILAGTTAAALAVAVIGSFEGYSAKVYRDVIGVKTVCYGETRNITKTVYTKAECDAMFIKALSEFETSYRKCISNGIMDDEKKVPNGAYVAFLSLSYNIGTGAFCKSTVAKKLNAGDVKAACYAVTAFNKAGGRIVKGLVTRRAKEKAMCLKGV